MQITQEMVRQGTPYIAGGVPVSAILFFLGKWFHRRICMLETKVNEKTSKNYADDSFQTINLCNERSGNIENTLADIKTDGKATRDSVDAIKNHLMGKA